MTKNPGEIRMVPVDRIEVLNHRERNTKVFEEISGNIRTIGLKKPITVTPRPGADGEERYLLVCGEGRLKAFKALGQPTIPALVVNVSDEDAFIMSLTVAYVEAMLVATPAEMLVEGRKLPKVSSGVTQEQMAKMEREMASLQGQYKMVEESYGQDVLNLVLARGYLVRLMENAAVTRFLKQRQPDVLKEFEAIVKTVALDQ